MSELWFAQLSLLVIQLLISSVSAYEMPDVRIIQPDLSVSERFLSSISFNSSTATALVSIGALSILLVATGLYLFNYYNTAARSDNVPQYDPYGHPYHRSGYYNKRSSDYGYDFNAVNILQWISMLQEVYEKFDYNDVDCQKLLICEVLKDEEYFGDVSRRLQNGFELAKYLEVLNMPDEFRELLDEYMDASERSLGQKECREFFQCPYSLKESVKRNFSGNSL